MTSPELLSDDLEELAGGTGPSVNLSSARHSKEIQYWRLCIIPECEQHLDNKGWITVAPAYSPRTALQCEEFRIAKHAQPLDVKYGRQASGEMFSGPTRFLPLIRTGGIHLMPLDQMVAYGWHRRSAYVRAIPELAKIVDIPCEHGCPTVGPRARLFVTLQDYQDHCTVMHRDAVGVDAMGRQITKALGTMQDIQQRWSKEELVQLAAAIASAIKEAK